MSSALKVDRHWLEPHAPGRLCRYQTGFPRCFRASEVADVDPFGDGRGVLQVSTAGPAAAPAAPRAASVPSNGATKPSRQFAPATRQTRAGTMRHSSFEVAVVLLASTLSCTSAAMWLVQLSTIGLASNETLTTPPSTTPPSADTTPTPAEKRCSEQIGKVENGVVMNTMPKYDVAQILEELGGAPGKVNATWNRDVPALPVADPESLLLAENNATFWAYDYRRTDYKTFLRREHALLRHKGQKDEFVDVRGELFWAPADFCGMLRHAEYRVDPDGFSADVTLEYCFLNSETLSCATPAECHTDGASQYCVG